MNADLFIKDNSTTTLIVSEIPKTTRIDHYITQQFQHYSRSFFQQLINEGHVTLNTTVITKQSTPVTIGDKIILCFPSQQAPQKNDLDAATQGIDIIHKNDHFMIINKPAPLLVHAPSLRSNAITVVDWIKQNHDDIKQTGLIDRPGIVHRLDKETSGLLIITRTNHAYQIFSNLFQKREIQKTYHAVVSGHPSQQGFIDHAIGRDPHNRIKMKAFNTTHSYDTTRTTTVRQAQTHYTVLTYFSNPDAALVELKPISGRTHQIRVHMTTIGHPLIGDQLYGKESHFINRHALHAYSLSFIFDDVPYSFTQEPPHDFQILLANLQKNNSSF